MRTRSGADDDERMTGIEPALSAWEAEVLPLNYIRKMPTQHIATSIGWAKPGA